MKKEELKATLKSLSVDELEDIKSFITELIQSKKSETATADEYEFEFSAGNDPRKGVPYVAKLVWKDGKLEREFYNLNKTYGKKAVQVWGTFKAKEGDIIEIREGGSWKNDYRDWYLVRKGKLVYITSASDAKGKMWVIEYLKGNLTAQQLLGDKEDKEEKLRTYKPKC